MIGVMSRTWQVFQLVVVHQQLVEVVELAKLVCVGMATTIN
jgi:hypothetical protein